MWNGDPNMISIRWLPLVCVSCLLCSAAALAGARTEDTDSPAIPVAQATQDFSGVETSTTSVPAVPGGAPKDTNITIVICVKANPGTTNSYKVKVGGATITVTPNTLNWYKATLNPKGGGGTIDVSPTPATFDDQMYAVTAPGGAAGTPVQEWCFKFTIGTRPTGLTQTKGNAAISVESFGNAGATGTPTDTASGGTATYNNA